MGGLKVWDGSQWVAVSRVPGPVGPVGDVATDTSPAGPASGHLLERYPNPKVNRILAGTLLGAQRINGPASTSTAVAIADNGTILSMSYTPLVDCWWVVECWLGYLQKMDAAYNTCYMNLNLSPADADGWTDRFAIKSQHSGVQQFEHRTIRHVFNLVGGTTYTAAMKIQINGGTWNYNSLWNFEHMTGKAWAK